MISYILCWMRFLSCENVNKVVRAMSGSCFSLKPRARWFMGLWVQKEALRYWRSRVFFLIHYASHHSCCLKSTRLVEPRFKPNGCTPYMVIVRSPFHSSFLCKTHSNDQLYAAVVRACAVREKRTAKIQSFCSVSTLLFSLYKVYTILTFTHLLYVGLAAIL